MRMRATIIGGVIAGIAAAGLTAVPAAQSAADGQQLYTTYCASCHGAEGKGDGKFAKTLKRRPADLTQLARRHKGEFPAEQVSRLIDGRELDEAHRKSDMPIWGEVFSKSQSSPDEAQVKSRITSLVRYLERIQDKHSN